MEDPDPPSLYEHLLTGFLRPQSKKRNNTGAVLERYASVLASAFLLGFERAESGAGWNDEHRSRMSLCAAELMRCMSHNEIKATQRQFLRCFPHFFWLMTTLRTLYIEMPYADTILPYMRRLCESPTRWKQWARRTPVGVGNILAMPELRKEFESSCRMQLMHSKPPQDAVWREFLKTAYSREDPYGKLVWQQKSNVRGYIRVRRAVSYWIADYIGEDTTDISDTPPHPVVVASVVRLSDKCCEAADLVARIESALPLLDLDSVWSLVRAKVASKFKGRFAHSMKHAAALERRRSYAAPNKLRPAERAEILWTMAQSPELRPRFEDDRMPAQENGQLSGPYSRFVATMSPGYDPTKARDDHSKHKRRDAMRFYAIAKDKPPLQQTQERFAALQWRATLEETTVRLYCDGVEDDAIPKTVRAPILYPLNYRDSEFKRVYQEDLAWKQRVLHADMCLVRTMLAEQSREIPAAEDWSGFAKRGPMPDVPWPTLQQHFREFHLWVHKYSILNWNATFGRREIVVPLAATASRSACAIHHVYNDQEHANYAFSRAHLATPLGASGSTTNSSKLLMANGYSYTIKIPAGVPDIPSAVYADAPLCPGCRCAIVTPTFSARHQEIRCLSCHFLQTGAFCAAQVLGCCEYPGVDALHGSTPTFWNEDDDLLYLAGGLYGDTDVSDDDIMFTERRFSHPILKYVYNSTCIGSGQPPREGGIVVCKTSLWPREMTHQDLRVPVEVVSFGATTSPGVVPSPEGVRAFFLWMHQVGIPKYAKYVVAARNNGLSMSSLRRAFCIFLAERNYTEQDFTGACDAQERGLQRVAESYAELQDLAFSEFDV